MDIALLRWFEPAYQLVLPEMFFLLGIALLISTVGFYRIVYFVSIGYAFSIVAFAIFTPLRHLGALTWASALQNLLLVVWGLRLGIYLVQRELRSSYQERVTEEYERSSKRSWFARLPIWGGVALLYVLMFSPSLFDLIVTPTAPTWVVNLMWSLGLLIMFGGIALEAVADKQKSDFKGLHPNQFCDAGLYRWVRCPNYLGEILFWIGNWVVGLAHFDTPLKWLVSTVSLICIVLIMLGSTKRLERSQVERYGDQPAYQAYIRSVPILLPFVPVYTLKNLRVYLE